MTVLDQLNDISAAQERGMGDVTIKELDRLTAALDRANRLMAFVDSLDHYSASEDDLKRSRESLVEASSLYAEIHGAFPVLAHELKKRMVAEIRLRGKEYG